MIEIPDTTVFIGDAIGIDPPGCGCTDCIIRSSIPSDDTDRIQEAVRQHFEEGRPIVNRSGGSIVFYRNDRGEYEMADLYAEAFCGETEALFPIDSEDSVEASYVGAIHKADCDCPKCEEGSAQAIKVSDEEGMRVFVEKYFREGFVIENHTDAVIVIGAKYGEFAFQEIGASGEDTTVSVFSYGY